MIEFLQQYNIELVLVSIAFGLLNIALLIIILFRKIKVEKQTEQLAKKLIANINMEGSMKEKTTGLFTLNNKAFVDGGALFIMAGIAIVAIIFGSETVPKQAVTERQAIKIDDSIYRCETIYEYRPVRVQPNQPVIYKKKLKKECK